jgi:hypothetical protein
MIRHPHRISWSPVKANRRRPGRAALAGLAGLGLALALISPAAASPQLPGEYDGLAITSVGLELGQKLRAHGGLVNGLTPALGGALNTSGVHEQGNTQVNDPLLDNIQTAHGDLFNFAIESETSVVESGSNIVVGYNSSAGTKIADEQGHLSQILRSAFSVSSDGGKTWSSGFVPPHPGSVATGGDPALAVDRAGTIYYANLGIGSPPTYPVTIDVNRSIDHGRTWSAAATVATPEFADKDWIAVGPDPTAPERDNVYVTWTNFTSTGSELWLARSTDGGTTWASKRLYAPAAAGVLSSYVQWSTPVADESSGRLYIPFLQFSTIDADFVKALVSDDGGQTLSFVRFEAPGAPEPTGLPNVTPGTAGDCGEDGGIWTLIHQGPSTAGAFGFPRWQQATRIITQPNAAASGGRLFIVLNTSTSHVWGVGAGSTIRLLFSSDGGVTWAAPVVVAPSTASEPQRFHPSVTVDPDGAVHVVFYTQEASGRIHVDAAAGTVAEDTVAFGRVKHVSTGSWNLTPSNITVSTDVTTNFDSLVVPCYDVGEYLSVTSTASGVFAAWGDDRKSWKEPDGSILAGVHAQPDVFSAQVP